MNSMSELKKRLQKLFYLRNAISLLEWDQQVTMPSQANDVRAETLAHMNGEYHRKFLEINSDRLLEGLARRTSDKKLSPKDAAIVREVWRDYQRASCLPTAFVEEFSEATSRAQHAWEKARNTNSFTLLKPHLEKIIALSRQKSAYLNPHAAHPYDPLLDIYEPDMTTAKLEAVFDTLKHELIPLVKLIGKSSTRRPRKARGTFPEDSQRAFLTFLNTALCFEVSAGRLDTSAHPFSQGLHPRDVRITTRFDEKDPWYAIGSDFHEVGHALYEQGLPIEHTGTPLAEAVSLGVHESQSRFWENMVGKNRNTWRYLYPHLKKHFPKPLKDYSLDHFYQFVNHVEPSLIRTEADEVTYNLHIILRFEIEKALIDGTLAVKDLPGVWNQKIREYLGIEVPDDTRGVLQDIHWPAGLIGYFPTYTLGNLYSAQLYETLHKDVPNFDRFLQTGHFSPIREWLKKKVHRHGRFYSAEELMRRATGSNLAVAPFLNYLENKYRNLYIAGADVRD